MGLAGALQREFSTKLAWTETQKWKSGLMSRSITSAAFLTKTISSRENFARRHSSISRGLWISAATAVSVIELVFLSGDRAQRTMPGLVKAERKPLQTRKKLLNK